MGEVCGPEKTINENEKRKREMRTTARDDRTHISVDLEARAENSTRG